jgi:hypothetical protein
MARRLIDISVPLQNDVPADPPGSIRAFSTTDHQQSLPQMLGFFAGLKAEDLPDGQGWAVEAVLHNLELCRRPVSPCRAFQSRPTGLGGLDPCGRDHRRLDGHENFGSGRHHAITRP